MRTPVQPATSSDFPSSRAKRSVVEGPVHAGSSAMNRSLHSASLCSAPVGTTEVLCSYANACFSPRRPPA